MVEKINNIVLNKTWVQTPVPSLLRGRASLWASVYFSVKCLILSTLWRFSVRQYKKRLHSLFQLGSNLRWRKFIRSVMGAERRTEDEGTHTTGDSNHTGLKDEAAATQQYQTAGMGMNKLKPFLVPWQFLNQSRNGHPVSTQIFSPIRQLISQRTWEFY